MARDKPTLSQRRSGKKMGSSSSADENPRASSKPATNPRHKKTEEELDDEFEAACEKWCGMGVRVIFAAYSLFGVATSTYEWAARPSMANVLDPVGNLGGTNVVLTGGCSGIGLQTARMLATRGARVVVGCRPPPPPGGQDAATNAGFDSDADFEPNAAGAGETAASDEELLLFGDMEAGVVGRTRRLLQSSGGSAVRYPLDLSDFASVRSFAARIAADLDAVDVVIHNAGTIAGCTNTTDGFEVSLQTNYLSPVLLNRLLLPSLKKAVPNGGARVVHVACTSASKDSTADADAVTTAVRRCHPSAAYADSKKLLERHSVVFSSKFEKIGVVANAVDPGPVLSDFVFKGDPGTQSRASRCFNPAALFAWVFGKFTTAAFGPFGEGVSLILPFIRHVRRPVPVDHEKRNTPRLDSHPCLCICAISPSPRTHATSSPGW